MQRQKKVFETTAIIFAVLTIGFALGFFTRDQVTRKFLIAFLNSGFFVAVVTFGTGLFVICLYYQKQRDSKKDAARLICQEVRFAEEQIRVAKVLTPSLKPSFHLGYKLLPTNNWNKNIHLFVNDLKESQIDLISRFYSQATYADRLIEVISDERSRNRNVNMVTKTKLAENKGVMIQEENIKIFGNLSVKNIIGDGRADTLYAEELGANEILAELTKDKMEFIYNSSAIARLQEIADGKF